MAENTAGTLNQHIMMRIKATVLSMFAAKGSEADKEALWSAIRQKCKALRALRRGGRFIVLKDYFRVSYQVLFKKLHAFNSFKVLHVHVTVDVHV